MTALRIGTVIVRGLSPALVAATIVATSGAALADPLELLPGQLELGGDRPDSAVTLVNRGPATVRLQLRVYATSEDLDGRVSLEPTDDVAIQPSILSVGAGRRARFTVTQAVPATARERAYQLVVEELPVISATTSTAPAAILRATMPLFLTPSGGRPASTLGRTAAAQGVLTIELENAGEVRAERQVIEVTGRDATGNTAFHASALGWHVLAGGKRRFFVALPPRTCRELATLAIELRDQAASRGGASLARRDLQLSAAFCGPLPVAPAAPPSLPRP